MRELLEPVEVLERYSNLCDQGKRLGHLLETVPSGPTRAIPRTEKQVQHRLSESEASELAAAYLAGETIKELAEHDHIHRTTVMAILQREGVETRYQLLYGERLDRAIELYRGGFSLIQISRALGVNHNTIRTALLKAGIALRSRRGWKY